MIFKLRIEQPGSKYVDITTGGDTLDKARDSAERRFPEFKNWHWAGSVAYVNGYIKAEDVVPTSLQGNVLPYLYTRAGAQ